MHSPYLYINIRRENIVSSFNLARYFQTPESNEQQDKSHAFLFHVVRLEFGGLEGHKLYCYEKDFIKCRVFNGECSVG